MCRIGFAAHVAHDSMTASCPGPDLADGISKRFAGRKSAAHDRCAIGAHHDTMTGPASSREVQSGCAYMGFQLSRPSQVNEPKRFAVQGSPPSEHGQAATCPAVPVECGIDVDDEALSQARYPPEGRLVGMPICEH